MHSIFEELNNEFQQDKKVSVPEAFQVIKESLKYGKIESEIIDTYYSTSNGIVPIEKAKKKAKLLAEITKSKHYVLNIFKNKEENFVSFAY